MIQGNPDSEAYQRILKTARDLFYRNGYRATGINEIIKKSDVAKATFYAHFPSKESLALAYVNSMNDIENRNLSEALAAYKSPYDKLLGFFKFSIPWSVDRKHRGCAYLNMSSEITNHASPIREASKNHYESIRALIGTLVKELKAEKGAAWKGREAEAIADDFFLIFSGAMALAQVYHDKRPYLDAMNAAKRLLA